MMQHTTVASILRAEQAYGLQLCEKETLDYGIVYTRDRFHDLPEFCQFREVVIENPSDLEKAFERTEQWFRERGIVCLRWVPADGAGSAELTDFLTQKGFRRSVWIALVLPDWPDLQPPEDVRVLPARAMRAAFRQAVVGMLPEDQRESSLAELTVEAFEDRLDDPSYDACVALAENRPAGWYALHQVGDIARIATISVLPGHEDQRVEVAMLHHGLTLAHRLVPRVVCATVDENDVWRRGWLERAGFVPDGEITHFDRITSPKTDA